MRAKLVLCLEKMLAAAIVYWGMQGNGAVASELAFNPDGAGVPAGIFCEVPTTAVGPITLKSGVTRIRGDIITVSGMSDYLLGSEVMLSGRVLKAESDRQSHSISGIAYFADGEALNRLDQPETDDLVFRNTGAIHGRIDAVDGRGLRIRHKDGTSEAIDLSSVILIRSPRAYSFRIAIQLARISQSGSVSAEADAIMFTPTWTVNVASERSILPKPPSDIDDDERQWTGDGTADSEWNKDLPAEPLPIRPMLPFFRTGGASWGGDNLGQ